MLIVFTKWHPCSNPSAAVLAALSAIGLLRRKRS
jgi:hypothetical protein